MWRQTPIYSLFDRRIPLSRQSRDAHGSRSRSQPRSRSDRESLAQPQGAVASLKIKVPEVPSVLCALSWSAGSLIGFRVLQGISGGLLVPLTQLMIARAAGKHMVRVMGYVAVPVLLGPIVGPVVAGAILQHESWVGFSLSTCRSVCWRLYSPPCFFPRMTTEHDLKEVSTCSVL